MTRLLWSTEALPIVRIRTSGSDFFCGHSATRRSTASVIKWACRSTVRSRWPCASLIQVAGSVRKRSSGRGMSSTIDLAYLNLLESILDLVDADESAFLVLGARLGAADADRADDLIAGHEQHAAREGEQIGIRLDLGGDARISFSQGTHLRRRHLEGERRIGLAKPRVGVRSIRAVGDVVQLGSAGRIDDADADVIALACHDRRLGCLHREVERRRPRDRPLWRPRRQRPRWKRQSIE